MTGSGGNGAVTGAGGRDWLSRTLRELRGTAGISGEAAGAAIGRNQPRISRIENGRSVPSPDEVRKLCALYKAPAPTRRALLQAVDALKGGTYPTRVVISRGTAWKMQRRIRLAEENAGEISDFLPSFIPGLLQTEDYMRLVFSDGGDITSEDVELSVKERSARASALDSGRRITLIMAEGALRWQAGSAAIMAEQLEHVAAVMAAAPRNVRIGVIPQAQPVTAFATHGFTMYDRRVVVIGIRSGTTFIDNPADVGEYVKLFGELEALTWFGDGAREVVSRIAGEYRQMG